MTSLIILLPFLAVMYFVMIRPQQKRAAEARELLASLEVGDEVVTVSGLYGVINEFDGPTVFLEVADGVEVKITRESISVLVTAEDLVEDTD
ncbi:MAG: preprotein translocase subunit YajC [Acidimicrobiia bacterium]|nr:preprotein translocase subunit YajC [Acidimicrobiia bacterium]